MSFLSDSLVSIKMLVRALISRLGHGFEKIRLSVEKNRITLEMAKQTANAASCFHSISMVNIWPSTPASEPTSKPTRIKGRRIAKARVKKLICNPLGGDFNFSQLGIRQQRRFFFILLKYPGS